MFYGSRMTLKEFRRSRGYTQKEFAKLLRIARATVLRLEKGSHWPSRRLTRRLISVTNGEVPLSVLLNLHDAEENNTENMDDAPT